LSSRDFARVYSFGLTSSELCTDAQLRNPLHAMLGALTVLESGDGGEEELRWQVM
jgi:hypothetical protein